jgi:hypothetical protein
MKLHKPDPRVAKLVAMIERYEAIRLTGDPEVDDLSDDIAWYIEEVMIDLWYDHNGIRYRVEAGELVRDTRYRKSEYGWRRAHKVAA